MFWKEQRRKTFGTILGMRVPTVGSSQVGVRKRSLPGWHQIEDNDPGEPDVGEDTVHDAQTRIGFS